MSQKVHSPRLATIKMVEETLQEMPGSVMKVSELKRALPKKVNHNTLKEILDYLIESKKIVMGSKGITWIVNDSPEFKKFIGKTIPLHQIISEKELEELLKK